MEETRWDAAVRDVPEDTADGTLEHEAAKAPGLVTTVGGGLHRIGDGATMVFMEGMAFAIFYLGLRCSDAVVVPMNSLSFLVLFASAI